MRPKIPSSKPVVNTRKLTPIDTRYKGQVCINGQSYVQLSANDYLGLSTHPQLIQQAQSALEEYGFGSTGSRLLSGDYTLTHVLEKKLSDFLNKEACLLFNSGYQLNTGVLPTLLTDKDVVFADKHCHASLIDGLLTSGATVYRYAHQNLEHLHTLITKHRASFEGAFIVSETLFSMDGDITDLPALIQFKKQFSCSIYIDDAHGFGLYGSKGQGLTDGFADKIDYIVGTFGKACGSSGAFIACDTYTAQLLINNCRSFIYSTALPLPVIAWNLGVVNLLPELTTERQYVQNLAYLCKQSFTQHALNFTGEGHIISVITESSEQAELLASTCQKAGFWVLPIRPPTVPKNKSRVRLCLSPFITEMQLHELCDVIQRHLT